MKSTYSMAALGLVVFVSGCTTSSQVQEMINASYREESAAWTAHGASIDVLKQSAMAALEQNKEQAATLDSLQRQLDAATAQLKTMRGNAEAAKVMSAANTVKVAELGGEVLASQNAIQETSEKMESVDRLFEEVMIRHYQAIAESAKAAMATLQRDDVATADGIPTGMSAPIEIIAPDTSASTNSVSGE